MSNWQQQRRRSVPWAVIVGAGVLSVAAAATPNVRRKLGRSRAGRKLKKTGKQG
jgi:hypothetical protein